MISKAGVNKFDNWVYSDDYLTSNGRLSHSRSTPLSRYQLNSNWRKEKLRKMSRTVKASVVAFAPLLGLLTLLQVTESLLPQSNFCNSHRVELFTQPNPTHLLPLQPVRAITRCQARRPRDEDEDCDDDDDDFDDFDYDYDYDTERRRRNRNRNRSRNTERGNGYNDNELDDLGYDRRNEDGFLNIPSSFGQRDGWRLPDSVSKALLAGIFILGVGLGVTVDSAINTNPRDLASRDAIDQAAPNAKLCADMGASAMAFDQRVFVSFNPFNVYVAQADVKPACVLRQSNIVPILKGKNLINEKEVSACKANMNTWAFVGDLDNTPQLSCVYKSADAQNEFLSNPKFGIGEDYLDDDRAHNFKKVKDSMTDGQKQELRKRAANVPGLD